jgi:hypothetical protein
MTPRRTAEERIANRSARPQPSDYGVGARAIWITSAGISGSGDWVLSGSDLPLELSRARKGATSTASAFADGRSRRAMFSDGSRREAHPGVDAFRALAFSTCSFGTQRRQGHCRIRRANL